MRVTLPRPPWLWQTKASGSSASIGEQPDGSRLNDADTTDWMPSSRRSPPFSLDAWFETPSHVPGWMVEHGARATPQVTATPLADGFGWVAARNALDQETVLADHYRRLLQEAPDWSRWRARSRGCFSVDIVIEIEGEHDLRLDMFSGAACGALEMLTLLADTGAPEETLYDNLDQGWALRMVATPDEVFTLEWNWERPAADDVPRALRFPRHDLAVQAGEALARLRHVHDALVQDLGLDLWNMPPGVTTDRRPSLPARLLRQWRRLRG